MVVCENLQGCDKHRALIRLGVQIHSFPHSLWLLVTCALRSWRGSVLSYAILGPNVAPPPHNLCISSSRQEVPGW